MIEILTLFRGHARFIYLPEPIEGDILALFQAKFKQVFQDLLRMVRCKLLFQIYDHRYDEYVDMGKDTVFGRTNKVKVEELQQPLYIVNGYYRMWSLMSHTGNSFVQLAGTSSVDAKSSGTGSDANDSNFYMEPIPGEGFDTWWSITLPDKNLALQEDGANLIFATRNKDDIRQQFLDHSVEGYYVMESRSRPGNYIGSDGDGNIKLYPLKPDLSYPNPAAMFLFTNDEG